MKTLLWFVLTPPWTVFRTEARTWHDYGLWWTWIALSLIAGWHLGELLHL